MDAALIAAGLAGAMVGFVASALPGLHVNTLAIVTLLAAPQAGAPGSAFLVAALAASPFGLALSSTFLGGTNEDDALQSLPAHALAREGRGVEAVALQSWGAMLGMLIALPLALPVRRLLEEALPHLASWMPWLLLAIVALLVLTEPRRIPMHPRLVIVPWTHDTIPLGGRLRRTKMDRIGRRRVADPHDLLVDAEEGARVFVRVERQWTEGRLSPWAGRAAALAVIVLSGALGLAAFRLGAASPLHVPSSPLLPLLAGLFALPILARGARTSSRDRRRGVRSGLRAPRVPLRRLARAAAPGAAASCLLGIAPGVSASHASLLVPRLRTPEDRLVCLAAVNGGGIVFTLLAWHALGKARSGALVAAERYHAAPIWNGAWMPPDAVLHEAAAVCAAALVACLLARALSGLAARWMAQRPRELSLAGLALLLTAVFFFNGALGLVELLVAGAVGALPARWGVRRSHAMGVILVPALMRAWGVG